MQYEPKGPIKGQVYVDFVVELSSEANQVDGGDFQWILCEDESSTQQGSGAGIILEGPNAFKASNNLANYQALVAGMLLGKDDVS